MKIAIISFNLEKYSPYLTFYKKILDDRKIDYDYFTWNRYGENIEKSKNQICFNYKCSENKLKKFFVFLKWKKWIISYLKKNKYDKVIILTTLPGILLINYLKTNYKGNYLFDYRDYTYEKYRIYKKYVNNLISNSYISCLSSKGFLSFLSPNEKIKFIHNLPDLTEDIKFEQPDFSQINIGYLGVLSYYENNKKLMDQLSKKDNVILYYIGSFLGEKNQLEEHFNKKQYNNVFFKPPFNNKEKNTLYRKYNINFINAIYGNDSLLVTTALPNKLYDCLTLKIPIIVSKCTYLAKIVEEYDLGITIDDQDDIYEKIMLYVKNFDFNKFNSNATAYLSMVSYEQKCTLKDINRFLDS